MTLCNDFIKQSRSTWNLLRTSERLDFSLGEETITDINLLTLKRKNSQNIITRKIPKNWEGKVGADWKWILFSRGNILEFRVQAKKLNSTGLNYPELGYKQKNGQRQIDLLIKSSLAEDSIPLYVFYNYWKRGMFNPVWLCQTSHKTPTMLGCGVAYAPAVRQILNNGSNRLSDITKVMYPWSCLVCCTLGKQSRSDLVSRVFSFTQELLARDYPNELSRERSVQERVPSYVRKMIERAALSEEDWREAGVKLITLIRES